MSGFGSAFEGTEEAPEKLAINTDRLSAWVGDRLPGFAGQIAVSKFKGGQSNPTYCLDMGERRYVLRRRPPGVGATSAHAIDREFKILNALDGTDVPVPHVFLYCDDESVIGSEFYLVEYIAGRVFWSAEIPEYSNEERAEFYDDLGACLAKIHKLDIDAIGLGDLAKREGFTARNLGRWWKTYQASQLVDVPDMAWLTDALRERLPPTEPLALIHGDYGVYNIIATPDAPRIAAVLDWEIATLGNPLVDLAHTMRPWLEPPAADGSRPTFADKDPHALGVPTLAEFAAAWSERTGITWENADFYLGFAMFRYACMIQGILKRYEIGTAANRNLIHTQDRVIAIAAKARQIVEYGAGAVLDAAV